MPKSRLNRPTIINIQREFVENIFIGDSLFANYQRLDHQDIWEEYFKDNLNLAVGGDRVENALWRVETNKLPRTNCVFILIGTNNLTTDSPSEIAEGIKHLVAVVRYKVSTAKIFVLGILPRGSPTSNERLNARETNKVLTGNPNYDFVHPSNSWFCGTQLNKRLFWKDQLHLVREGYLLLNRIIRYHVNNRDESVPLRKYETFTLGDVNFYKTFNAPVSKQIGQPYQPKPSRSSYPLQTFLWTMVYPLDRVNVLEENGVSP